jgi:putative transposase
VDTEGLILKAKVHSAKVPDQDGLRLLLESARSGLSRLSHLWLGTQDTRAERQAVGRGGDGLERGGCAQATQQARTGGGSEAVGQGVGQRGQEKVNWQGLMPPRGYVALPRRRWVVERTFSWLSQHRRMSKDYEKLCASAQAFMYAAMIRLMVRRLARV